MAATNLLHVPKDTNVYIGADAAGHVKFNTSYTLTDLFSECEAPIGVGASLALGLTECCARYGEGKVSDL
jgi:hypothetical protein